MKKFLKNIILFTSGIFLFVVIVIVFSNKKINETPVFKVPLNVSTLILGHSHSQNSFNDSLIHNTKNFSQSGEIYFYSFLKLKKVVSINDNIKNVFVEFSNNQICLDMEKWTKNEEYISYKVPKYAPIMDVNDYKYIISQNPIAFVKTIPILFQKNLHCVLFNEKDYIKYSDWGGFFRDKNIKVDSLLLARKTNPVKPILGKDYTEINLKYLDKIIRFCKINNINVYLVRSPQHKEYTGVSNEKKYQELLNNRYKDVSFLDFNNFPLLNEEYRDLDHLNYKGARKFSIFFNTLLIKGMLDKKDKQEFIDSEMKKLSKNIGLHD